MIVRAAFMLLVTMLLVPLALAAQAPADSAQPLSGTHAWSSDTILGAAPAGAWLRVQRGFTVGTLSDARDGISDAPSLPRALQGRLPGVSVSQGEGLLGASSRVWLRGPTSMYVNEPLLIIDGARTHAATWNRGQDIAGLPSRLEDIDPAIIERVDVLRGVAASAIYGPGASKGAILVTTKRGHAGPTRWSGFAETGLLTEPTAFPANHGTLGVSTATGLPTENCPLAAQASGTCTPVSRRAWNPLENASPYRTGWNHAAGIAASGGTGRLLYRAGVNQDRAKGVYHRDEGTTTTASINMGLAATPSVDVRLSGAYRAEDLRHPVPGYVRLGLMGAPVDDPDTRGYGDSFGGHPQELGRRAEHDQRVTAALDLTWRPASWLRLSSLLGYDRIRSQEQYRRRTLESTDPNDPSIGDSTTWIERTRDRPEARTGTAELEAAWRWLGADARSAVGFQYLRDDDRGHVLEEARPDVEGGLFYIRESRVQDRRIDKGFYARQHLGWRKLFITGSVRAGRPDRQWLGRRFSPVTTTWSHAVDASWVAIRTPGQVRGIDALRLRGAYALGGGHLIPTVEVTSTVSGISESSETAERMSEIEAGVDVALLGGLLLAQATGYRTLGDEAIGGRVFPFGGFPIGFPTNEAAFRTHGFELTLDARLLQRPGLRWDAGIGFAMHHLRTVIEGAPASIVGAGEQSTRQGRSVGEYYPVNYEWIDRNGDRLIAPDEVSQADGSPSSSGSPWPDHEASLHTEIAIGRGVRLSALVDRRAGQQLYNYTHLARCRSARNCVEQHDPATPLADQAAAVAARSDWNAGYVEDATFTKLREARLSIALPKRWSGSASSAHFSITGRNLYTWTDYSGLDPEVTGPDRDSFVAVDMFYQPPLRTFTARLDLSW